LCYVVGCVHKMAKPDMSMEPKITCSKIFIFQPILEFQKHFHYTDSTICEIRFFKFSQEGQVNNWLLNKHKMCISLTPICPADRRKNWIFLSGEETSCFLQLGKTWNLIPRCQENTY
jgi:hypothetical protein